MRPLSLSLEPSPTPPGRRSSMRTAAVRKTSRRSSTLAWGECWRSRAIAPAACAAAIEVPLKVS
jgi:hypothetical protein